MFGHHPDYDIKTVPAGFSKWLLPLGSFVYTFKKPVTASQEPDFETKLNRLLPRFQTLSLCMIVKDAEETLARCLNSAASIIDELIVGIDEQSSDTSVAVIERFKAQHPWINVVQFSLESPLKIGFDAARNETLKRATGDWIMWLDADEYLVHPTNIFKYMRNNQFNGYAIQQHHISIEPVGILKTDLPVRLFRNYVGIKFFGVVHEHPEKELNKGVGHVQAIYDVEIAHSGYTDEQTRRGRFNRNIDLLVRDREKYPERYLGKMLWLRDLAQMCKYQLETNGGRVTPDMKKRAEEGIKLWEELVDLDQLRMAVDSLEFYSLLCQLSGDTIEFGFTLDASKLNGGINLDSAHRIVGKFRDKDPALKLFNALATEKVKDYEQRYF
jgi:glycosyltransferase involved in cell wall biosynthesis